MKFKTWGRKLGILVFWLLVWECISLYLNNPIIFVGPMDMAASLYTQIILPSFWQTIFYSFSRIFCGFLAAFFLGILSGSLSYRFSLLNEVLEPVILLMKSVPVASFIILALIWAGSENLAALVSFLIVYPVLYIHVTAGLRSTDKQLLEMAKVFHISGWKKAYYIYRPALMPYLISSCRSALGMSWKSGIAAEVIGVPESSIGEQLYMAKIYLNTADLFAWTFVIIIASTLFEKLFLKILQKLSH